MSTLALSPTLKHDLLYINDLPDSKSDKMWEILRLSLIGRLADSEILSAAEEMQIDSTQLQTSIAALSFYVSELVRVSVPKEVS